MPLTATIAPALSAATAADSGSPAAPPADSDGPHAGHAFGCAWKRRSSGSSYSAAHGGHI